MDALDEEERILLSMIDTDPLKQADDTIKSLNIRERRMMKRIQDLKNGLKEKQRRVLQERKTIKEAFAVNNDKTGETKIITVSRNELVVTEVEETEFRAIDNIIRLEEALTRIQDKRIKATKNKHDLLGDAERQTRVEKMKHACWYNGMPITPIIQSPVVQRKLSSKWFSPYIDIYFGIKHKGV